MLRAKRTIETAVEDGRVIVTVPVVESLTGFRTSSAGGGVRDRVLTPRKLDVRRYASGSACHKSSSPCGMVSTSMQCETGNMAGASRTRQRKSYLMIIDPGTRPRRGSPRNTGTFETFAATVPSGAILTRTRLSNEALAEERGLRGKLAGPAEANFRRRG